MGELGPTLVGNGWGLVEVQSGQGTNAQICRYETNYDCTAKQWKFSLDKGKMLRWALMDVQQIVQRKFSVEKRKSTEKS